MQFLPPPQSRAVSPDGRTIAAFLIVALIWGSTWIIIKDQISAVPPGWTIVWRFVVATLGCFALAAARGDALRLPAGAQRIALLVGLFQFCANFQFVYRAEAFITSGIAAVLYALLMVPNALFARLFLRQRISGRFVAGSAVAIAGIALLLVHEFRAAPPQTAVGLGVGLTVCGMVISSLANVAQATKAVRAVPAVPLLAWSMLWGTAMNIGLALVFHGAPAFDPRPQYWGGIVYLGLVGTVLTFPLYFHMIRTLGAGRAAYNGVAVPVVAMLLSTLFEGYGWSGLAIAGAALAVAGLLVALSARR